MLDVYLDIETAGLKGKVLTIQYSLGREAPKFVRVSKDPQGVQDVYNLLMNPEVVIKGYNIAGFDIWKLYQLYQPEKTFKCWFYDLYLDVLTRPPFSLYNIAGGKAVAMLKKIPKKYSEQVITQTITSLRKIVPNFIDIHVKHIAVKDTSNLVSLQFIPRCSKKLKTLMSKIFGEQTIKTGDAFILPEQISYKENTRIPIILADEQAIYDKLYQLNEDMLDDAEKSKLAVEYALNDIKYLWMLEDFLNKHSKPTSPEHENQVCGHAVAYTKYKGFTTDPVAIQNNIDRLAKMALEIEQQIPINLQSTKERKEYLQKLTDFPVLSTGKKQLELMLLTPGIYSDEFKAKVKMILQYKPIQQRLNQLKTLQMGNGRAYPDFRIIGTSTQRMAGAGGFNYQGISREGQIRQCIKSSMGGDFSNLEVNIAAQYFMDIDLENDLENDLDLHTMTATLIDKKLGDLGYAETQKGKNDKNHPEHPYIKTVRNKAKSINFAILYFCQMQKVAEILEIPPEDAEKLMEENFFARYKGLRRTRKIFEDRFCTADFNTWSKTSVANMQDSIADIFGNTRYVKFEKAVARLFWENSNMFDSLISEDDRAVKMIRQATKGPQTYSNALKSACLGAASGIQKSVMRSVGNFPIQSSGAHLTKILMSKVFLACELPILNVHDELLIPEEYSNQYTLVKAIVEDFLREYRDYVPTLKMDFDPMKTWADKN